MLKLLKAAAGRQPFAEWAKLCRIGGPSHEKLDSYLEVLYRLLEDVLHLQNGDWRYAEFRRPGGTRRDWPGRSSFEWIRRAVRRVDELVEFLRRNIQKSIALDALGGRTADRVIRVVKPDHYRRRNAWSRVTETCSVRL